MKAILFDVKRCRGCMKCVSACGVANGLTEADSKACFARERLSERRFTTVSVTDEGRFLRRQCLHCLEPSCESACLVGALRKTEEGPVLYDSSKCIGCRYCMLACPFEVPRYEWDTNHPYVVKCQMCADREGGPACVAACPYDASMYGDRDDLIAVARERIASGPGDYLPHIWGEHDAGGTCVLFVSDVDLGRYWPKSLGDRSVPEITWPVMAKTPFVFFGVAGVLSAVSFIIHRRERLRRERAEGGANDAA